MPAIEGLCHNPFELKHMCGKEPMNNRRDFGKQINQIYAGLIIYSLLLKLLLTIRLTFLRPENFLIILEELILKLLTVQTPLLNCESSVKF